MNTLRLARYSETALSNGWNRDNNGLTQQRLEDQNTRFKGNGGVSEENRSLGFMPAFADTQNGRIYLSRFADGRLAPMHILDGLPEQVVETRDPDGRVTKVKETIIAGFVRDGHFYTREQAARFATKH